MTTVVHSFLFRTRHASENHRQVRLPPGVTLLPQALGRAHGAAMPQPTLWQPFHASVLTLRTILFACCQLLGGVVIESSHDIGCVTHALVCLVQKRSMLCTLCASHFLGSFW